jgi:hypothetical protein
MRTGPLVVALGVLLWVAPATAQRPAPPPRKPMAELVAAVARATQQYREVLERSLPLHAAQVQAASDALQERRDLLAVGVLSAVEVQDAERALAAAQRDLHDARAAIDEADEILLQAEVRLRLERLAPLPRGGYEDSATLVRFNGGSPWSLKDMPRLEQQFAAVFQRSLPVSAAGQTKVHDRLRLDHRTAIDVAVHPDSGEGRWLMAHLRRAGIPFIGVRGIVPGSSTGAHVHIGPPSARLLAR